MARKRITVDVERLSHTGEGIAHHDGQTWLMRGALPGERVVAEVEHVGRVGRGHAVEILRASDERVEPPCPHVDRCGGCDLMHASPALQLRTRLRAVTEQLEQRTAQTLPEPIVHRPTGDLGYRSRARLRVRAQGQEVRVGFHRPRSRKLAAIDACIVLRPELQPVVDALKRLLAGSHGTGEALVGLGEEDRICVELSWDGRLHRDVFARADAAVTEGRELAGIRLWEGAARVPATFGEPGLRTTAADGLPLHVAPGGFAQVSDEGGRLLGERVGELAAMRAGGATVELFAGSGTLTVAARPAADRYVAVERDAAAVQMLRDNLAARGLTAKVVAGDAEAFPLKRPLATVILDPPRAGAPRACESIAAARPRQIIYVSCNPATLARDLAKLGDYRLEQLEIVDLFPQTSHVETIARLTRR